MAARDANDVVGELLGGDARRACDRGAIADSVWRRGVAAGGLELGFVLVIWLAFVAHAWAQESVARLPPVTHLGPGPLGTSVVMEEAGQPALSVAQLGAIDGAGNPLAGASDLYGTEPPAEKLPGAKDGVLQNVSLTWTWLAPPADDDLGQHDLEASVSLGFPFPTARTPLVLTPAFGVHYLEGPDSPDLPARLYDASLQVRLIRPIGARFTADVAVTPGVHSDFEIDDDDALKIDGRGFGVYQWSDTLSFVGGIAYYDRRDVSVVPIGGAIWKPTDDWNLELIVPRPKIARRLTWQTDPAAPSTWAYVSGEFGGGVWVIERPLGTTDEITTLDYRILLGLERKVPGRVNSRLEVGYVFGRNIEFRSGLPDYEPDATFLVRAGASY